MPEGPEVKLTAEYLTDLMGCATVTAITFRKGDKASKSPRLEIFQQALPLQVESIQSKGKLLYFTFSDSSEKKFYITNSLRMTGRWQEVDDEKHCRWHFTLANGKKIYFHNPRRFATICFYHEESGLAQELAKLGPSIMTEFFTFDLFQQAIKKYSRRNITSMMMDQGIFSGCGNYIKAEALYEARVSPLRKAGSLTVEEQQLLFQALINVAQKGYENKGLTIRDYLGRDGQKGEMTAHLKIYNTKEATTTKTPDGRVTHWDPNLQK